MNMKYVGGTVSSTFHTVAPPNSVGTRSHVLSFGYGCVDKSSLSGSVDGSPSDRLACFDQLLLALDGKDAWLRRLTYKTWRQGSAQLPLSRVYSTYSPMLSS